MHILLKQSISVAMESYTEESLAPTISKTAQSLLELLTDIDYIKSHSKNTTHLFSQAAPCLVDEVDDEDFDESFDDESTATTEPISDDEESTPDRFLQIFTETSINR